MEKFPKAVNQFGCGANGGTSLLGVLVDAGDSCGQGNVPLSPWHSVHTMPGANARPKLWQPLFMRHLWLLTAAVFVVSSCSQFRAS